MTKNTRETNKKGLERREFLKLGAAGVTATIAGLAIAEEGVQVPEDSIDIPATAPKTPGQNKVKVPTSVT